VYSPPPDQHKLQRDSLFKYHFNIRKRERTRVREIHTELSFCFEQKDTQKSWCRSRHIKCRLIVPLVFPSTITSIESFQHPTDFADPCLKSDDNIDNTNDDDNDNDNGIEESEEDDADENR
jgi:hypothetical protein